MRYSPLRRRGGLDEKGNACALKPHVAGYRCRPASERGGYIWIRSQGRHDRRYLVKVRKCAERYSTVATDDATRQHRGARYGIISHRYGCDQPRCSLDSAIDRRRVAGVDWLGFRVLMDGERSAEGRHSTTPRGEAFVDEIRLAEGRDEKRDVVMGICVSGMRIF